MKFLKTLAAGSLLVGAILAANPTFAAPFDWKIPLRNSTDTADYSPVLTKAASSTVALVGSSVQYPVGTPIWYYVSDQFGLGSGLDAESRTLRIDAIAYDVVTGLPDMLDAKSDKTALATTDANVSILQSQVGTMSSRTATVATTTRTIATSTGATGWQLSTSSPSDVRYSSTIVTTASIAGAALGSIVLETAATATSTWVEAGRCTNGQALSLAVALQSVQTSACQLSAYVPAGSFTRLRSITTSGSPVYSWNSSQEVIH